MDYSWISIGGYNVVVSLEESSSSSSNQCQRFMEWIFHKGLIDMGSLRKEGYLKVLFEVQGWIERLLLLNGVIGFLMLWSRIFLNCIRIMFPFFFNWIVIQAKFILLLTSSKRLGQRAMALKIQFKGLGWLMRVRFRIQVIL